MRTQGESQESAAWKQRFRTPVVLWAMIAKDAPARGLAASNLSGVTQLCAWDVPTGSLRALTARPEGVLFGLLSSDGRYVYYAGDRAGSEIGHHVRVSWEGGVVEDLTPDLPPYSSIGFALSRSGTLAGLITAAADGYRLYGLDLEEGGGVGAPRCLYHSPVAIYGPALSSDATLAVITSTARSGTFQFTLVALDTRTDASLGELWDGPGSSVEAHLFAPLAGDDRLLIASDRTGDKRPATWRVRTGERSDLALDALVGEVVAWDWSADSRHVLLCGVRHAVQHLYVYALPGNTVTRLHHPAGTLGGMVPGFFAPSGEIIVPWHDSTHPQQIIALDAQTGARTRTVLAAGEAPAGHPWRSVTYPSTDGQEIQAWLALPEGAGPFPAIIDMHGGPMAVATDFFLPQSQAWLDHGFAFLSVNYRGSTTFGRAFAQKIWGDLGHWEVEDLAAGRNWLVEQGLARADAVFLTGWSYGGYLVLQGLGTHPALWAGGMAGIAVADRAAQYAEASDAHKAAVAALMGGTPQEKPEQYAASSPITYAAQVQAPVVVIQGRNDSRCPAHQMELYEARMRALGKQITVQWFDAGHLGAFTQVDLAIEYQEVFLRFRVLQSIKLSHYGALTSGGQPDYCSRCTLTDP